MNNENYVHITDVSILIEWIMQDLILFVNKQNNLNLDINKTILAFQNENKEKFKGVHYVE